MKYSVFVCLLILVIGEVSCIKLIDTSVSCDQKNFVFNVHFDEFFGGLIYSENGYPNCVYVNGSIQAKDTYTIKIPLKGCASSKNGEGNLENAVIIQQNFKFLQKSDKKYLLTCIPSEPPKEQENFITVNFGGVKVDSSNTEQEVIKAPLPSNPISIKPPNVKYTVQILNGHDTNASILRGPLNIGDDITYVMRLENASIETHIGRCWATDSSSEMELSDKNGCTLQHKGDVWHDFERKKEGGSVLFVNKIKAWSFPTSNEVNIFCNLRICMSGSCSNTACDKTGKNNSTKRVRREKLLPNQLQSEIEGVETVKAELRFKRQTVSSKTTKNPQLVGGTDNNLPTDEPILCLHSLHIFIIIMAFVIFLLIGIIAMFCILNSTPGSRVKSLFS
uniref:ZP domain-containing protein n=1 Tax=Rhabditophanes sp. KR3021 TaxID=114890 RepID=A0AC35TRT2_9BILA